MRSSLIYLAILASFTSPLAIAADAAEPAQSVIWNSYPPPNLTNLVFKYTGQQLANSPDLVKNSYLPLVAIKSVKGSAENVSITATVNSPGDKQFGGIDIADSADIDFRGSTFDVKIDTDLQGTGNNMVDGLFVWAADVKISAENSTITVRSTHSDGKSAYGAAVNNNQAKLTFSGKTATVRVESATERTASGQYSEAMGLDIANGSINSTAGNTLNIIGQTTGTLPTTESTQGQSGSNMRGTTPLSGIKFEGGQGAFEGDVNIDVASKGGLVEGVKITNFFFNTTSGNVWGNSAGNFNNLQITAASQSGDAYGVASTYVPKEGHEYSVILNVSGEVNIDASSASGNAYGIHSTTGKSSVLFSGSTTSKASVDGNGEAYAVYLGGASAATLGGTGKTVTLSASASGSTGKAIGAQVGEGSTLTLIGSTTVAAKQAFTGNGTVKLQGELTVGASSLSDFAGTFNIEKNGRLAADPDNWFGSTASVHLAGGTLEGASTTFFTGGLGADGFKTDAGETSNLLNSVVFESGSVSVNDAKYNLEYASNASKALAETAGQNASLVFTGTLVTIPSSEGGSTVESKDNVITKTDVDGDKVQENVVYANATLSVKNPSDPSNPDNLTIGTKQNTVANSTVIDQSMHVKDVELGTNGTTVLINNYERLTLVGGGEALIKGSTQDELKIIVGGDAAPGYLELGHDAEGVKNGGVINASVDVKKGSIVSVNRGEFTSEKTIDNAGAMVVGAKAVLDVKTLNLADQASVQVLGDLTVEQLGQTDAGSGLITIGSSEAAGSMSIADSKGGHQIFLDPAWISDVGIEGASKLIYKPAAVNDKIVVGENSYAVIGSDSEAAFLKTFAGSGLKWSAEGVTAAVYLAKPISVNKTSGALTVDGSLNTYVEPAANAVKFASKSLLMTDASAIEEKALITVEDGAVEVSDEATAVLANVKAGTAYKLFSTDDAWTGKVLAANAMFEWVDGVGSSSDGVVFGLKDAADVYGSMMQGTALANAAMKSVGADYDYANGLLTSFELSAADAARRFDAAMNPAGAMAAFTTAKDRSSELVDAVRAHAGSTAENGLWVEVAGGKTKLKGISTGGLDLDVDTDSYGLVLGGEAALSNFSIGGALTAGSGKSENDL